MSTWKLRSLTFFTLRINWFHDHSSSHWLYQFQWFDLIAVTAMEPIREQTISLIWYCFISTRRLSTEAELHSALREHAPSYVTATRWYFWKNAHAEHGRWYISYHSSCYSHSPEHRISKVRFRFGRSPKTGNFTLVEYMYSIVTDNQTHSNR